MLQIPCPWCGIRDEADFSFGGESHITRPDPETVSDADWANYLFYAKNPLGWHYERWCHSFGCGRWFNVVRNTVSHEIFASYEMGAPAPEIEATEP